ncbi:MAG: hypothetical protein HC937_03855 [Aquincola sp.]|nr:hypothetical protein [Aquincola sp.]
MLVSGCSAGSLLRDLLDGNDSSGNAKGSAMAPDMGQADEQSVAKIYNEGLAELQSGSYKAAQKKFEDAATKIKGRQPITISAAPPSSA